MLIQRIRSVFARLEDKIWFLSITVSSVSLFGWGSQGFGLF